MTNEHSRLVDEVGRTLEEEILAGELRPGDRLTVVPLTQRFGTSQSTIRESLLMLERRGLVKTNPRHGTFVTRLTEQESLELCRMRALIESYAVTVGLPDMPDADLERLRQLVMAMSHCVLPRDLPRLIQIDLEFHRLIAEMAGSATLLEGWSNLSGRIGALIMRSMELNELRIEDVVQYHAEVVDALATRNPRVGRIALVNHYVGGHEDDPLHIEAVDLAAQAVGLPASDQA